jgi:hypothetical protein
MRLGLICAGLFVVSTLLFPISVAHAASDTRTLDIEAQLVWGTNGTNAPAKLRLVGPRMSERLKHSPFKWDHYYEMNRQTIKVKFNETKPITMSKHCEIKITNLGDSQIKLDLFGKGQLVNTVTQALPKGELLVVGGDAENSTAWFVILRQAEQ